MLIRACAVASCIHLLPAGYPSYSYSLSSLRSAAGSETCPPLRPRTFRPRCSKCSTPKCPVTVPSTIEDDFHTAFSQRLLMHEHWNIQYNAAVWLKPPPSHQNGQHATPMNAQLSSAQRPVQPKT
ncbi:hypothetical protein EJ03DRAFT_111145 [Teratosphaeria nubilosa]|uniref:Uncharacterized protein n=1 Tax=Teratosphaeria nubilosa TaxID=161662 RepID=A0A6G1L7M8_9PEZI|nr:hypothetical protein EJ03DRAFT_111145 [Teratosphaeria nubilosa]